MLFDNLDAPVLYVSNVELSLQFYEGVLGLTLEDRDGDFAYFSIGNSKIAINKGDNIEKFPGKQTIILRSKDINETFKKLENAEVEILQSLHDSGYGLTFMFADIDGNKIEVI